MRESLSLMVMALALFFISYSDLYKVYVTVRMKPYLYGASLMLLILAWASVLQRKQKHYEKNRGNEIKLLVPLLLLGLSLVGKTKGIQKLWPGEKVTSLQETVQEETEQEDTLGGYRMRSKMFSGHWLRGYDEVGQRIRIKDDEFYYWMIELQQFPEDFAGYDLSFKARVDCTEEGLFLMREMMTCCVADLTPLGIIGEGNEGDIPDAIDWAKVSGVLEKDDTSKKTQLHLRIESLEPTVPPLEVYIYPPY